MTTAELSAWRVPLTLTRVVSWIEQNALRLLGGLLILYVIVFSAAAFLKFDTFRMGFDLGVYEQAIWNTTQGRFFESSVFTYTGNHLGSDPVIVEALIAPIYALFPTTYTLFVLQVVAIAASACGVYLIAQRQLGRSWMALALTACFLAYPPLQYFVLYEFQPRAFAVCGLIFAFYFIETGRFRAFLLSVILALTTRSDVALVVGMLGVYAFLERKPWRFVLTPIILGGVWFVVALVVIVPAFRYGGGSSIYIDTYRWLGSSSSEMIMTFITRPLYVLENVLTPGKLTFLFNLLAPFAFLPLLRPKILLMPLPILVLNLLSPDRIQWDIRNHYDALIIPFVAIAAIYAIRWLSTQARGRVPSYSTALPGVLVGIVLIATALSNPLIGTPLPGLLKRIDNARIQDANAILTQVPADAKVAAHNFLAPHLARRRYLYFFPPHQFYTNDPLARADYVAVDLSYDGGKSEPPALAELQQSGAWVEVARQGDFALYKRR